VVESFLVHRRVGGAVIEIPFDVRRRDYRLVLGLGGRAEDVDRRVGRFEPVRVPLNSRPVLDVRVEGGMDQLRRGCETDRLGAGQ
jgi:hypothetical protein